jgi:hypothetical protein
MDVIIIYNIEGKIMTSFLAVFRSRSQAVDCQMTLKSFGINAETVNTPREANIGCGLSVLLPYSQFLRAKSIILKRSYSAFYGFYKYGNDYGGKVFAKI